VFVGPLAHRRWWVLAEHLRSTAQLRSLRGLAVWQRVSHDLTVENPHVPEPLGFGLLFLLFLAQVPEDQLVRSLPDCVHHTCFVVERIEDYL
jgi:hypothetical protein